MKPARPIYMDYQATTPCDPEVVEAMIPWFSERFGNASSRMHVFGNEAHIAVAQARESIAKWIGASSPQEIVFTSGATESNNMALVGSIAAADPKKRHIIISGIEHEAVMDPASWLAERGGCTLTVIPPDSKGRTPPEAVAAAIREDTLIVSVMHANNVIGTVNDIAAIGALCRERGVTFHTDIAQSVGKVPFDVEAMNVDLASISAHKIYGPKGAGVLYARRRPRRIRLEPITRGGGQERGLRPGTLAVPLIVGLGKAAELAIEEMPAESERLLLQRGRLFEILNEDVDGLRVNGSLERGERIPGNLNVSFAGVESEALLVALRDTVALSAGSACATSASGPSRVLVALGVDPKEAAASIRFGIGRFTTDEEIELAGNAVVEAVGKLRR